ncbi:hypothetical protein JTE90_013914 [Oedothorax gibbosus]|uniref:Uncharacterized protein n=1 Tax=Oedothorax gibbosus TaxID=931172 RepID=A0AAV6UD55_9ARAC|nr:hypothetical protein JTE90_013914 [Oedothorax gibbosus]
MFKEVKNFKKEDLKAVALEIGEDVPPNAKIAELKNIILNSDEYKNDPDFVKTMLENVIYERKTQEEQEKERLKLEKEATLNLEKLKIDSDKEAKLEVAKLEAAKLEAESKLNFEKAKMEHELELARIRIQEQGHLENQPSTVENGNSKRKFTLPKLEFRRFGDDIKEWLPFWSQFERIDKDEDIANEDKFQYLIQATIPGSRAREVVESFPPTSANYSKAIESLKARFGREDLLVEVYVRELLKLIISVQSKHKFSPTSLYDKLESYLRALESLGVTKDKCASILYPMVESCFPEDFLKAWNRSTISSGKEAKETSC